MASRELGFRHRELAICDGYDNDCYTEYRAIANQEQIIETARVLNAFGNEFVRDATVTWSSWKEERGAEEYFYGHRSTVFSELHSVVDTVDTLVEWLEHAGNSMMKDLKKREAVLRGVLRLTELGSQASLFGMLEFAFKFLDVPDDPYPAEREYIKGCLRETEIQKQRILQITKEASDILKDIIDAESLDISKAKQFDNVLRKASLEIDSCERRLKGAEEMMGELMRKMKAVKWFSRGVRAIGLGVSALFFYKNYNDLTISLFYTIIGFIAACFFWLSLFPQRAYELYKDLSVLDMKHRLLAERLEDIHERLDSSADHKDKVVNERNTVITDE